MNRLTLTTGALAAALVASAPAIAPVAPHANKPNDTVADTVPPPSSCEGVNLEAPQKAGAAATSEAKKRNWDAFCFAVVGPSGDLVYFEKQDNCQFASVTIAQHKARVAARYRRPTLNFENLIGKGPYFNYLVTLDDVVASRGGNPLMMGGKVIGAIGVSGGSGAQDDVLSQAGVAALK